MPELPEVENVRRSLMWAVAGATIAAVRLGAFTGCIAAPSPAEFAARVTGRRIVELRRRGKYLLLALDSGETIAVHLRMTGELTVTWPDASAGRHHHLTLALADGREIRFSDTRKFGRLRLLTPAELAALDRALGPEPLDERLTPDRFAAMLAARSRAVKPLLLDQSFLAGIGNIYADEALFLAQLHPLRPANSFSPSEAARLLEAIRAVLRGAIARGGTTLRDYRDGLGRPGSNQHYLQIYHLDAGDPCPRCGEPIARLVVGQRGTRFCPRCQPLATP
ncbi:MAG: bifunctional DNA-formamidopyrimidine glycosylase/DNA-(apurinic or apyrimidinic site) lyase [Sphaerobacter sp.]|nr:bifunctional DNA-formamidopyrimidine glycosylase/DNA-(apurinic or apyrimidinic site) lyase [Sphaerobacter sp.]